MSRLRLGLALTSAWLVAVTLWPALAFGHFGGSAYIVVRADHINPGETFDVVAADLTPNATIALTLSRDERQVSLGETVADAEGHFSSTLPLPADFPSGYAQLVAIATDGTQASTWVLVGLRTSATPPPPGQVAWWADPSVIVLGGVLAGAAGMIGYAMFRRRSQRQHVPVAAGARRRSSGKAHRRATRKGPA